MHLTLHLTDRCNLACRYCYQRHGGALFRRNEAPKAVCEGCALEGRCHNRCACLNFQTTGGLENVPPILCEHERFLQPLCDELAATLYAERNPLFLAQHYDPAFPILSILDDLGA